MKVSILVPIYCVEKYIEECCNSLFSQDYPDIEYIFVDDCSPDKSIEILKKTLSNYVNRKDQVKIIRHSTNLGLGAARESALMHATGEAIMHVDSDDFISSSAISTMVKKMEMEDSDIVEGAMALYCDNKIMSIIPPFQGSRNSYIRHLLCLFNVQNGVVRRLYKKSLYTVNNIHIPKGVNNAEDLSVSPFLFFYANKISKINDIIYFYRIDNCSSYTHNYLSTNNILSSVICHKHLYDYFSTKKEYDIPAQICAIDLFRSARKYGYQYSTIEDYFKFTPSRKATKLIYRMIYGNCPYFIADFFYRVLRFTVAETRLIQ